MIINDAKNFLTERILVESSLTEELVKIDYPLAPVIKQCGINFLSKNAVIEHAPKITAKLEFMKNSVSDELRPGIEQAILYFKAFIPEKPEVPEEKRMMEGEKFRVISSWDTLPKKIGVEDFTKYFQARFQELRKILQSHGSLTKLTSIGKISNQKQDISIIGMVANKRTTKNKNVMLELEDLNGKITVLIHNSKPELIEKSKSIVMDEVIGINGNGNNEIIFAKDIIFPDITGSVRNSSAEEEYAVFTSDIHIGSNKFIEDKFVNFLSWLNGDVGNEDQKELSKKIKYLFIIGDTVDGVGVYPGQADRLLITDLKLQYKKLAEYLNTIRKDITIFMCPGQHDASRIAEPQPPIDREYAEDLYHIPNLVLVSNPAMVEIAKTSQKKGIKVFMYHGASFHSLIEDIEELRTTRAHDNPTKVSRHLLRKRHIAPSHSTTDHLPLPDIDPLVIREIPDVFASGDLHRPDIDYYGPILLVASSCWQHITEFEEKVGNHPDPCKVPILNLKTGKVNIIDFS